MITLVLSLSGLYVIYFAICLAFTFREKPRVKTTLGHLVGFALASTAFYLLWQHYFSFS